MAFQHSEPKYHMGYPQPYYPDIGMFHVAAWRRHQTHKAMDAALARLAEAIALGEFTTRKPHEAGA